MKLLLVFGLITTVLSNVDQEFTQANKWFSASIYKKFAKNTRSNFLLSPFSVEAILALTHSGSKGQTAEEIERVLNSTEPVKIKTTFRNLLQSFKGNNKYTLKTANKIYVQENFSLKEEFIRVGNDDFGSNSESIDFGRRKEAAQDINQWVEKQLNNKIHNLVDSSNFNDRTRAVLINALYFKANWSRPFLIAYNKPLKFHLSPSEEVLVDMMILHDKPFNYYESTTLKAEFLELPFKGDEASMVVVLPNEIDGLASLENQMKKVLKAHPFSKRSINLFLPKFKIETSADFKKILKHMGISRMFDDANCDLSGIAGEKGDLVVDKVFQKTFIDVSEEGVEAAAATYTLVAIPMSAPAEVPKNFRVDRPFIFYIKVKGVIVFVGRVVDPRK